MTTTAEHTDLDRIRFFIDGEWVDPRGSDTHRALEAATGEPLGTAALGTDADIDAAVKAARRARCRCTPSSSRPFRWRKSGPASPARRSYAASRSGSWARSRRGTTPRC